MKTLNSFVKASIITSLITIITISNQLSAQDITGKWESLAYSEVVHFHEEGVLRMVGVSGEGYGMYAIEDGFLSIAFFNEEETRMNYSVSFDEDGTLNLQESETGDIYPFVYTGDAEIPVEVLSQVRLALNGNEENDETPAEEVTIEEPSETPQLVNVSEKHLYMSLPGTLPAPGTRGRTGIVGTWQQESNTLGKETLVLTSDGYFMITAEAMFPDLYPQTYGYGKYEYENGQMKLHFFNYFQTYEKETVWNVKGLNGSSFNVPYDFYGDIQDNRYLYKGAPELSESHRRTLLAWVNFHRLQGQWRSKDSVLKFIGNGEVIVESSNGKYTFSQLSIANDGITASFEPIDGEEGNYFYSGKIKELTSGKLVLQDVKGGEPEAFTYEGETQMTSEQIQVYTAYMNAQHRTNMRIIDMMDGVQDWIWVEKKY